MRGCKDVVVVTDGIVSSLSLSGCERVSVFAAGVFPSPIAVRNTKGLQITSQQDLAHASFASSASSAIILHSVQLGAGEARVEGGYNLLGKPTSVSCQIPGEGVVVIQRGRITKCADESA
eukprot:CAMPEP_0172040846 /NCGR_PEP_ID=MMETSP1041-20130122/24725_1 /TAXON_ID=464988 /ORGANISM="Hemiselmis andersenii, Strain CCMP439" /LENGTH=119 /DNA_ID=CAMNT_0012698789 /DNA_START=70 /DNA_END=426 /DNA_ORIENTATION=-